MTDLHVVDVALVDEGQRAGQGQLRVSHRPRKQRPGVGLFLESVARGVMNWANQHGWRSHRVGWSASGSRYVLLIRRTDGARVFVRIANHRLPRPVDGIDVEWISTDHAQVGVKWLRDWLSERAGGGCTAPAGGDGS